MFIIAFAYDKVNEFVKYGNEFQHTCYHRKLIILFAIFEKVRLQTVKCIRGINLFIYALVHF